VRRVARPPVRSGGSNLWAADSDQIANVIEKMVAQGAVGKPRGRAALPGLPNWLLAIISGAAAWG